MKSRKLIAIITSVAMVFTMGFTTSVSFAKTVDSDAAKTASAKKVLRPYMLTGYYDKTKLNCVKIEKNAKVKVWNAKTKKFKKGKNNKKTIYGNFTQLVSTDKDKKAEIIYVVKYKDKDKKWDASVSWIDGAGVDAEPSVSDEVGRQLYKDSEFRIPNGERLLKGWGLGDYSGTTDFANIPNSKYYPDYDWYNVASNDSLTILTGYKSQLQTTGWACVMSSMLSVLEWYGVRDGLNEQDLAALRSGTATRHERGTEPVELNNAYKKVASLGITGKWKVEKSQGKYDYKLLDFEWVKAHLAAGHPIQVTWNSFGGHGQVIIGYDDMGTEVTSDDVFILMDPYDTTDHDNDGYNVQSAERLAYGVSNSGGVWEGQTVRYYVAYPEKGWKYTPKEGTVQIGKNYSNAGNFSDANKIPYGNTLKHLREIDPESMIDDGLGGAAAYERAGDYNYSPYYALVDFSKMKDSDTMTVLDGFKTCQQATEWSCGCDSAYMTMNWFGTLKKEGGINVESPISLSTHRKHTADWPGTYQNEVVNIFDWTAEQDKNLSWKTFTNLDLDDPTSDEAYIGGYCLQAGDTSLGWPGLIPYLLKNDIPMMIGWDEWGGHWQTIVGYDNMGTEGTQDDVLILADSYDTTDHNGDGYYLEGFERLVYGWNSSFEYTKKDQSKTWNNFVVAIPDTEKYADVIEELGL